MQPDQDLPVYQAVPSMRAAVHPRRQVQCQLALVYGDTVAAFGQVKALGT